MSRTDVILEAVQTLIEARRVDLDAADQLSSLNIYLKFKPGSWAPRKALIRPETEHRLDADPAAGAR